MDLTKENDVVMLMQSSRSEKEWNKNCDLVQDANGGNYPSFWYASIVLSGVADQTRFDWIAKSN